MTRLRICVAWPRAWAGLPVQCRRVDLRLHLPLHPVCAPARHWSSPIRLAGMPAPAVVAKVSQRHHDDLSRRLGGRRPKQRIEWLEQDIRSGDQRDPADGEPPWRGTPLPEPTEIVSPILACSVAASCWSSTTPPAAKRPLEHAQCAEVCEVVRWNGEDRSAVPRSMLPAGLLWPDCGNGAVADADACSTSRWRATAAATAVACRCEPTGPCQSRGTELTAVDVMVVQ